MGASTVSQGVSVLALLSASRIPAIPTSHALRGLAAGILAALNVAENHTAAGELAFTRAVETARAHPDYGYSREFLAGVVMVLPELEALAKIGGQS